MRPNPLQRRGSAPAARRRHSRRLVLEPLESRVVPSTTIDYSGGFADHSGLTANGSAGFNGSLAVLTTGGQNQAGSIFTNSQVDISHFTADFTFTMGTGPNSGGGLAFVMQSGSPTALGTSGIGLGFSGIPKVFAVTFYIGGEPGAPPNSTGTTPGVGTVIEGMDLHSTDQFEANLSYDGSTLHETLKDLTTGATFSHDFAPIDIVSIIGSQTAFIGFSGGTGTLTSAATIQTFLGTFGNQQPAAPTITSISPSSVQQNSAGFTLSVFGSNFVSGATVQLNGTNLPTSFISGSQLSAFVSSAQLATVGSFPVSVTQGTATSNAATFTVTPISNLLIPVIGSISPSSVQQGSGSFTLTVNGSNFVPGALVQLNGITLPTAFVNVGQLNAFVSSSMLTTAGTLPVVVSQFNGQSTVTSNTVFFTITPTSSTSPTITSLSPNPVVQSNSTLTLTVFGSNFVAPATVQLVQGTTTITLSATVTSSNLVQVSIPGSLLNPGLVSVTVSGPNGTSNAATLVVTSTIAAPTITSISPSSVQQNSAGFTLSVFGSNFVSGATVQLNGASLPTSFISSSQLSAFVSSAQLTAVGSFPVTVTQGTATSNAVTLTVTPISNLLIPVISSISPSSVQQGSAGFTLSVFGSNFLSGATVQLNGASLPTSFVSSSQLSAFVSSSFLTNAGSFSITVSQFNGQSTVTSNVMTLTVRQQTTTTITATGLNITGTANVAQDFTVAQFTDSAPNVQPGSYAVSIDFGDGTPVQSGHVTQPGGPGTTFFVDATHTYTQTGTFTVHVRIFKEVGGSAETFSTATVTAAGAPQAPGGGGAASAGKNLLFTQAVGQGPTATANTNAAPLQMSTALQSGQSSSADDLYWQLVGQGQGFTASSDLVAGQLASALDGATL